MIRWLATVPIVLYQRTLSPDHGVTRYLHPFGYCQFYPTCSEYCRLAVLKHGVMRGYLLGILRILRCHPLAKGGVEQP